MRNIFVGTNRFIGSIAAMQNEMLEIRAAEITLARIHWDRALVGNRIVCAQTIPDAIANATGCTTQEASTAISEYSELASKTIVEPMSASPGSLLES